MGGDLNMYWELARLFIQDTIGCSTDFFLVSIRIILLRRDVSLSIFRVKKRPFFATPPFSHNTVGLLEGVGLLTMRRVRPITSPSERSEIADNGHRAKPPENPANISLSGQNDM
jgi:hypothetical protein